MSTASEFKSSFFQGIVSGFSDPLCVYDTNRAWVFANTAFSSLMNIPQDRIPGGRLDDYFPPAFSRRCRAADLKLLSSGSEIEFEEPLTNSEGESHHLNIRKSLISGGDGTKYIVCLFRIIDKLKKTQQALENAGTYHRALFEASPMGLALCNMNGQLIDVNVAYAAITGRTPEEMLRLTYFDITPAKYAEEERCQLDQLRRQGRYGPYEKEYIHKDGHVVPVRLTGVIVRHLGEQYIWSSIEDISEKKKAETELEKTTTFLNSILEHIPEGVFVKDAQELRYLMLNKGAEQILNLSRSRVLGKTDLEVFPPEQAEQLRNEDREVLSQPHIVEFPEIIMDLPNDNTRYIRKKKVPVFDSKGRASYLLGIAEDVTALRVKRAKLEQIHSALESTEQSISRVGADGKFTVVNASFAALHGYAAEPLLGAEWLALIAPADHEQALRAYQKMKENGIDHAEVMGLRKNGSVFPEHLELIRLNDGKSRFDGFYLFGKDLTEKRLQQEFRIKEDMTAMVGHEFRTPLHCVKEGVSILMQGLVGELSPKQKDILVHVEQSTTRLLRLVGDFIDNQKFESGNFALNVEKCSLLPLIRGVCEASGPLLEKKGLSMKVEVPEDLPDLRVDRDRISQVLLNLVGNAVKYSSKGSITIAAKKEEARVVVSVSDEGIGISGEYITDVFKKFYRINDPRKDVMEGAGLGLAIVENIIKNHGGTVWVTSEYDKGSTFYFDLPLSLEPD